MKVCVDTNLFISIRNKEADAPACKRIVRAIERRDLVACISTIVIAEMLVGFYQGEEDREADSFFTKVQKYYEILPVTIEIAKNAALIRAKSKLKLPDALILASAKSATVDVLLSKDHPLEKKDPMVLPPQSFADKFLPNAKSSTDQ